MPPFSEVEDSAHVGPTIIDIGGSSLSRSRSDDESDSGNEHQLKKRSKVTHPDQQHDGDSDHGYGLPSPEGSFSASNGEEEGSQQPEQSVFDLGKMVLEGLNKPAGQEKRIPTLVLYDDRGLQLFDEITYLEEYYLTNEEIDVLTRDADRIVEHIPDDSIVVELGAGSLRKTVLLLDALERKRKNIRYYALDVMVDELTKSLKSLGHFSNVATAGLWGTYDEGLKFLTSLSADTPKTVLWLGSSIGNLTREEALDFLKTYCESLNVGDSWLIGIDRRNDPKDITLAYNDSKGLTREFILNGLDHINVLLGQPLMDRSKFEYHAFYNEEVGRHEAYVRVLETHQLVHVCPKTDQKTVIDLEQGELINIEYSYKWSLEETAELFDDARLTRIGQWTSQSKRYDLHMLRKAAFHFQSMLPESPFPSPEEWVELWKASDTIMLDMIQHPKMLLEKPIDLRHPFIFYLGHIPVFMDLQLSRVLGESPLEPSYFGTIFERGIDPDVDDPTKCHAHSDVPDIWPDIKDILDFRNRARQRMLSVMRDRAKYPMDRRLARMIFMTFEHEAMHLETLLYMLVQSPNTMPPPKLHAPWVSVSSRENSLGEPRQLAPAAWIEVDPTKLDSEILSLGHDDEEGRDLTDAKDDLTLPFGWDNENPLVQLSGPSLPKRFKIQSRQVANGEYYQYLRATGKLSQDMIPASWILKDNGEVFVRSVYGPVPIHAACNWPVSCSQVEAKGYIHWLQSTRPDAGESTTTELALPTEAELSIVFKLKQAQDGLRNDNFGFRNWYPVMNEALLLHEADSNGSMEQLQGPGALWDWTSTEHAPLCHPTKFHKSKLYPGYSSDFFDGKHYVVLGGSWATHPRLAMRRSFRNWYQANYPYVFAGFRLVERS